MVIAFVRTVILYLLIIAGLRLMGKRQIGELEPSDLVLALLIADLAAVPMQDFGIPLLTGVVPILTLLCITSIFSVLSTKSPFFRTVLCGRPSIIIENGELNQREMRKNRLTIDELTEELRLQGCPDPSAVKYAILETNGQLSVLPYAAQAPATPAQLGLTPEEPGIPRVIVSDGVLLRRNLNRAGRDDHWLYSQLKKSGLSSLKQVFLLTVDETGKVCLVPKAVAS